MNWYRRAADEGNDEAMHNIGALYENGLGVPKDSVEARKWFRKAEEKAESEKTLEPEKPFEPEKAEPEKAPEKP